MVKKQKAPKKTVYKNIKKKLPLARKSKYDDLMILLKAEFSLNEKKLKAYMKKHRKEINEITKGIDIKKLAQKTSELLLSKDKR